MGVPTVNKIRDLLGDSYQKSDDQSIKLYVETHQFYRKLKRELNKSELMIEHTNKAGATNFVKNPLAIELTKTVQTLNNLLKSLGLTPAQRKSITGDDDSDFDDF